MKKPSVILLSGGLDSTANLAFCADLDEPVLALTLNYGQRAAQPEIEAARRFSDYYGVCHRVLDIPWLGPLGGSALTHLTYGVPHVDDRDLDRLEPSLRSAKAVWVPNRNGIMIAIAAAYAEAQQAEQVVVGFNSEEAVTFPDNSTEFMERSTSALAMSTANRVRVHSYTDRLNKAQIVEKLRKLPRAFPFDWVWPCYEAGPDCCKKCESCRRFIRALEAKAP